MGYRYKNKKTQLSLTTLERRIKEHSALISTEKEKLNKDEISIDKIKLTRSEINLFRDSEYKLYSAKTSYLGKRDLSGGFTKIESPVPFPVPLAMQAIIGIFGNTEKYNGKYYRKDTLNAYFAIKKMEDNLFKNENYQVYRKYEALHSSINNLKDSIKQSESYLSEYEEKAIPLRKKKNKELELKARAAANEQETRMVAGLCCINRP